MGIQIYWATPNKTLLIYEVQGPWTWGELQQALQQAHRLLDEVDSPTPIIADFRQSSFMPDRALWRGTRISKERHANTGLTIYIGASRFMTVLFDTFKRVNPELVRLAQFVDTLEEAYALLEQASIDPPDAGFPTSSDAARKP